MAMIRAEFSHNDMAVLQLSGSTDTTRMRSSRSTALSASTAECRQAGGGACRTFNGCVGHEEYVNALNAHDGGGGTHVQEQENLSSFKTCLAFKAGQSANGGIGAEWECAQTLQRQMSALEPTVVQT